MTRVLVDKHAGFCAGVKRTIRGAKQFADSSSASRNSKLTVVSYGELIHNPEVTRDLKNNGIGVKQKLEEITSNNFVIIRAHGIPPSDEQYLKDRKIQYLDLTCIRVKEIHQTIEEKHKEGFNILIVGDPDHPEVRGHLGYARGSGAVVSGIHDAENYRSGNKLFVLAQTTTSPMLYQDIVSILKQKGLNITSHDTICPFVRNRQQWLMKYSKISDASLIIGGENSSNTEKLYTIALNNGPAYWIKSADELELEAILEFSLLAVTAGASTPDESILEVIEKLKNRGAVIEQPY